MTSEVRARLLEALMKISPLKHENSIKWFDRAEDYFAYEDLSVYLQEQQPMSPLDRAKDKKMLAILKTLVDESMSTQLGQFSSAASAWSHLKTYYENKIDRDDFYWLNKIENFQLQEEKNLLINFEQLTTMFNSLKKVETLEDYKLAKFCSKLNQYRYNNLLNNNLLKATNEENFRNHLANYDNQSNDNRNQRRDDQQRREGGSINGDHRNDRRWSNNQQWNQSARSDRSETSSQTREYSRSDRGQNKEHFRPTDSGSQTKEYARPDHHNNRQLANRTPTDYRSDYKSDFRSSSNNLNSSRRSTTNQDQPNTSSRSSTEGWNKPSVKSHARSREDEIINEFRASNREGDKGRAHNPEDEIINEFRALKLEANKGRARNPEDDVLNEFRNQNRAADKSRSSGDQTSNCRPTEGPKKPADKGRARNPEDDVLNEFRNQNRAADKSRSSGDQTSNRNPTEGPKKPADKGRARNPEDAIFDEFRERSRESDKGRVRNRQDEILDEFMNEARFGISGASNRSVPKNEPAVKSRSNESKARKASGSDWGSSDEDGQAVNSLRSRPIVGRKADKYDNPFLDDGEDDENDECRSPAKQDDQSGANTGRSSIGQKRESICNGEARSPLDDKERERSSDCCSVDYDDRYRSRENQTDDWLD